MAVFGDKGVAAARRDEIAARPGVSRAALRLYVKTREDLFRAVVEQATAPNSQAIRPRIADHPGPITLRLRRVAERIAMILETLPVGGVVRMVIGEARNFPELARVGREPLVAQALGALTATAAAARARGAVKPGDPRVFAVRLRAPLLIGVIWLEAFVPVGAPRSTCRRSRASLCRRC